VNVRCIFSDLLLAFDDGQSFGHQLLVDAAEVGHFLLALVMNVHAALCTAELSIIGIIS